MSSTAVGERIIDGIRSLFSAPRRDDPDWLAYDPDEGVVEADGQMDVTVTLDATEAVVGDYEAELHFHSNDPDEQDVVVRVFMHVDIVESTIQFTEGWNMISLNITPTQDYWEENENRGPDIRGENHLMLQSFLDEDGNQRIEIMKNGAGDFCVPAWNYYGIQFWNLAEGYLFKVTEDIEATWTGSPIDPQTEIAIDDGWNVIAYYPNYDLDASVENGFYVLSPIIDHVLLAKDVNGNFLSPRWEFSNMLPWTPGQGYQINVDEEVVLVYPEPMDEGAALAVRSVAGNHWTTPASTGENMSVLVTSVSGIAVEDGDQIAAFSASDRLIGAGTFTGNLCGLAVWGDNRTTEDVVEGLQTGEVFELRLWDADEQAVLNLNLCTVKSGNGLKYTTDELTVLDAAVETRVPGEYQLSQCRPNPFNAMTVVSYGLPEAAQVMIRVFDVTGRQVATLVDGERQAGSYTAVWDGRSVTSGIYIVWMETGSFKAARKVMLVR